MTASCQGIRSDNDSGEERDDGPDWSPPTAFNYKSEIDHAASSPHNMEGHGTNINEDSSSSEGEVSPYFQRPQPTVQIAKRKERSEEDVKIHSIQQRSFSSKKCFNCAKYGNECVGTYPFTERCGSCRSKKRRCYPEDEGQRKTRPAGEKCYPCRQSRTICDGAYPFAQACSSCKKITRTCTAEKPEKGLPKDQKCQRCAKDKRKCFGKPPFKDKCAACKDRGYKCYAQGVEVPVPVPQQERCVACKKHNNDRSCDGQKPCTQCVTHNQACNYEDGDVKWTYQPDPEKWKEPTSPVCNECLKWDQSHFGRSLPCDGKSPCDCCLEELNKTSRSPNCTYHYENGVSKFIKLHGEHAQLLRRQIKSQRDRRRDRRQERIKREAGIWASQNDSTTVDEDLLDEKLLPKDTGDKDDGQSDNDNDSSQEESGSDSASSDIVDHGGIESDPGGESDNEYPNQDHDHNHDHRSNNLDDENSESYDNSTQEGATDRDPDSPDDQDEWEESESSSFEDQPNASQAPDPKDCRDRTGHKLGDRVGSRSLKSPDPAQ